MRENLAEALPLTMPFLIQIFPAYACNFRCSFCLHALDKAKRGYISDEVFMSLELYKKAVADIADMATKYGKRLKMLRFAAWGEPLLHKDIAEMVAFAVNAQIADSVEIVTNGSVLTRQFSDALANSGLSKLRISLEGISSEDYKNNCGADIDFEQLVESLRYFYEHRKKCRVYVKIIDYMLKGIGDEGRFRETFTSISDEIAVECLYDAVQGLDYKDFSGKDAFDRGQNAQIAAHINVCPQPFYMMQINPDGNVIPCCSPKYPKIFGSIARKSLDDIWNGEEFGNFRITMLNGAKNAGSVCEKCKTYIYGAFPEDNLDVDAERLKIILKGRRNDKF